MSNWSRPLSSSSLRNSSLCYLPPVRPSYPILLLLLPPTAKLATVGRNRWSSPPSLFLCCPFGPLPFSAPPSLSIPLRDTQVGLDIITSPPPLPTDDATAGQQQNYHTISKRSTYAKQCSADRRVCHPLFTFAIRWFFDRERLFLQNLNLRCMYVRMRRGSIIPLCTAFQLN